MSRDTQLLQHDLHHSLTQAAAPAQLKREGEREAGIWVCDARDLRSLGSAQTELHGSRVEV